MLKKIKHKFVKEIPQKLEEGILYISMDYRVSRHLCCCGCGEDVVIMFSPTDWSLLFNGPTVSIKPSIGNWGFSCQSHYYITKNKVVMAGQWSQEKISQNRKQDIENKKLYYGKPSFWRRLFRLK